jgi:hypothetical protein
MRNMPATVVSSTLKEALDWPDATVVSGDAVEVVGRLKEESEVPLRSHGSLSLNRALMAAGLVDRVQVTLFPVITGRTGTDRVFEGAADFDLELIESRTLDGRTQELIYRPTLHNCRAPMRATKGQAMTDSRTTGGTRPFRFGVTVPIRTDLPTWRDRIRRLADSGYSTLLMPDVPQWQPAPGPTLAPRRRPHRPAGGHLGVCCAAASGVEHGVGSPFAVGGDRGSLRDGCRHRKAGDRRPAP